MFIIATGLQIKGGHISVKDTIKNLEGGFGKGRVIQQFNEQCAQIITNVEERVEFLELPNLNHFTFLNNNQSLYEFSLLQKDSL